MTPQSRSKSPWALIHRRRWRAAAALLAVAAASTGWAHGDVTPQAVDTTALPKLGEAWRAENPFRANATAIKIGDSAYNQNCARCHGLQAISGGIAPDLRKLDNECATLKDSRRRAACVKEIDDYFVSAAPATARCTCRRSRAS